MKRTFQILFLTFILLCACYWPYQAQAPLTDIVQTAVAATLANTPTSEATFTSTYTFTPTSTPTITPTFTPTFTPTATLTSTITFTPTFAFPKVTVNKALAACLFGPAKVYLWKFDLKQGDTGVVWGRAPVGDWLYVKMDRWYDGCWLSPYVVDVQGDVNTVTVAQVRLWITDALYSAPKDVRSTRDGDQVTVTWDEVYMTRDDDRGYFLDVWVCQDGNYVWLPTALPDQYHTSISFTDQPGCSQPSGGKLYTVEKHGYTSPVDIPWPP
jgi:hypothetical protein